MAKGQRHEVAVGEGVYTASRVLDNFHPTHCSTGMATRIALQTCKVSKRAKKCEDKTTMLAQDERIGLIT